MLKRFVRIIPLIIALPLAACDALGLGDDEGVSLSFAVPQASASGSASVLLDPITVGNHTIDVQRAELTFEYVLLNRQPTSGGEDAAPDPNSVNSEEMINGPFTVALPLNGGVVTPSTQSLPVGTYNRAGLEIASVHVQGTWDGQAFDVTIPIAEGFFVAINPPVEVTNGSEQLNVTLSVDVNDWFRTSSGLIDPNVAGNDANRMQTRARVAQSFMAIKDNDRDGQ